MLVKMRKMRLYIQISTHLLLKTKRPWRLLLVLLGRRTLIELRNGIKCYIATPMEALVLAETALLDCYRVRELKNPSVVVDVGAAFGDFVLWIKNQFPNCRVIAFEPFAVSFRRIEEHVRLNDLKDVQVYEHAIGSPGTATLFSSEYGPVGASIKQISSIVASEKIEVLGLDQFLKNTEVDLLKIDCEGAELEVLESLNPANFSRIKRIALEYHELYVPGQTTGLREILKKNGFLFTQVPDGTIPGLGYMFAWRE